MAKITVENGRSSFSVRGSQEEIKSLANRIATEFRCQNGAWISNGTQTVWVPSSVQIWVDPAEPLELGLDVIKVGEIHREEALV